MILLVRDVNLNTRIPEGQGKVSEIYYERREIDILKNGQGKLK